jgi:hypothetical protein
MSDAKRVLILHLSSGADPLLIAVASDSADQLAARLPALIGAGTVETIEAANGSTVAVHFGHVLAAHVDLLPPLGHAYGLKSRAAQPV